MIEKDKRNSKIVLTILLALLVVSVIGNFYLYNSSFKTGAILLEEKALLDAEIYDWAVNEDNPTELFFTYFVYNYGNVEAKNVKIKCTLYDEDGTGVMTSVVDNFGNLASKSYKLGEAVTKDVTNSFDYYTSLCHVESCDNCEILYKRIPELVEVYE
ncbi:hypothetical protein KAR52_01840 [Candidatus Pacearchaeota archaeon]|nr:hypothetical protein [Candidatus Pacearchaeota archaeon]